MARKKTVRMITPPELAQWVAGFDGMGQKVRAAGLIHWQVATEVFFSATQEFVHILSGDLLATGKQRVFAFEGGKRIIGEVQYGSSKVVYALIENNRGGDHAFLVKGWEQTKEQFSAALVGSIGTVFDGFRNGR